MTPEDLERRIRQFDWPASSPALRARVIAETSVAPVRVIWSDRVWFSRTFRWSIAAAMVALMAVIRWPAANVAEPPPPASVVAEQEAVRIAAIDAGLPEDVAAALARRAVAPRGASTPHAADLTQLVNPNGGF